MDSYLPCCLVALLPLFPVVAVVTPPFVVAVDCQASSGVAVAVVTAEVESWWA